MSPSAGAGRVLLAGVSICVAFGGCGRSDLDRLPGSEELALGSDGGVAGDREVGVPGSDDPRARDGSVRPGRPDASRTRDAGRLDTGVPSGPCDELAACCGALPGPTQRRCEMAVASGSSRVCSDLLDLVERSGLCGGSFDGGVRRPDGGPRRRDGGVSRPDGGRPRRDAGVILGPACTTLRDCCGTLPVGQEECMRAVESSDEATCRQGLGLAWQVGLCLGGRDGGTRPPMIGPECNTLLQCCAGLPIGAEACEQTVRSGSEPACRQILDVAERFGYCDDAVPPGLGPRCSVLLSCCPGLPIGQEQCEQAAHDADERTCGRRLELARRAGLCR